MKMKVLDESSYGDYENFLLSCAHSLFYHSVKYKIFLEDLLNCKAKYLLAYSDDKVVAALPLMVKEGPYGTVVNSLPYYGSNGGIIAQDEVSSEFLLNEYNQLISQPDIASATYVENPLKKLTNVPLHNSTDTRIGQFTAISCRENFAEEIFKRISGNRRNEIRRAEKHGVEVSEENAQLDFIRVTHQQEMKEKGRKYKTDDFFLKVQKHFVAGLDYKVLIARREGQPIAGLLNFYFNKTVEYFTPVVMSDARIYQPMSLILYEAFLDAMQRGFDWFNWGGTWLSQEGVYRFKKQMGAQDFNYNYYIQINNQSVLDCELTDVLSMYPDFYLFNFNNREFSK